MRYEEVTGARSDTMAPPLPSVLLAIPADKDYVVLVRSVASHLGARLSMTLHELDDLRLAVGEACALILLSETCQVTGGTLDCRFGAGAQDGALHFSVTALAEGDCLPLIGGFGWNLLSALVDDLRWLSDDEQVGVHLVKRSDAYR